MKRLNAVLLASLIHALSTNAAAPVSCQLPWLFFDLGENTLIDTDQDRFDWVRYMPGAGEYLQDLRNKGYHVGLLVNVPDTWGATREKKLQTLMAFISRLWAEPMPMNWSAFDLGVRLPPTDAQRKPSPYLFHEAMLQARAYGCDAVYQSTVANEMPAAYSAGMVPILLGRRPFEGSFYYPESRLRIRDFSLVR